MAEFPAMPLWTDAYLADTHHLTTFEHGAYFLLLMTMWRTPEKRLPNDPTLLARYCGVTSGQWKKISPVLMRFFQIDGEWIFQGRLSDEADFVKVNSLRQSDKAKTRWLKNKDSTHAPALPGQCPADAPTPTPTPTPTKKRLPVAEPPEFADFWASVPHREGSNPRFPALQAYIRAIKNGADPLQINAAAKRWNAETDKIDRFVKTAVAWLNARMYEDYHIEVPSEKRPRTENPS